MIRIQSITSRHVRFAAMEPCAVLGGCQTVRQSTDLTSEITQPPELSHFDSREFSLSPEQQVVGGLYSIRLREGDTLPDVARHYGLGYVDIVRANPGVDPWVPPAGSRILRPMRHILPDAPREGIVLNLANTRLFYFPPDDRGELVYTYSAGIGREGWETPTGAARIAEKAVNPPWYPPASILRERAENGDPLPRVDEVLRRQNGIPTPIVANSPGFEEMAERIRRDFEFVAQPMAPVTAPVK